MLPIHDVWARCFVTHPWTGGLHQGMSASVQVTCSADIVMEINYTS